MRILADQKDEAWKTIYVEDIDDLWYLHNIFRPGDEIRMTVLRRMEKQDDLIRSKEQSRKPVNLTIRIESVEFQEFVDRLKILGTVVSDSEDLRGEHQSFLISPGTSFDLGKIEWNTEESKLIKEAQSHNFSQEYIFISLDDEQATLSLMRSYGIQVAGRIDSLKSGKYYESNYSEKTYLAEISSTLKPMLKKDSVILILGPGFTHDHLYSFLRADNDVGKYQIYNFSTSRSDQSAVYEFLTKPESDEIFSKSRLLKEGRLIEEFMRDLKLGEKAAYGYETVLKSIEAGAADKLMITEEEFRKERSRIVLDGATHSGCSIHIFSSETEAGRLVRSFGGYCAILRY
ncbi:MAG: mRNA surveillance protein pelota [Thermoplasmataceae archaeon]